jgi:hypothetical protein
MLAVSQSTQQKIVPLRFFHTIRETMHGIMSNGEIQALMRRLGMSLLQMEWTSKTLTVSCIIMEDQFIHLKIAPLKFFHMTKKIMPGTMSNGSILL